MRIKMYTKLSGRSVQVTWSLKSNDFFCHVTVGKHAFIKGRHTTIPVTFGKYFR